MKRNTKIYRNTILGNQGSDILEVHTLPEILKNYKKEIKDLQDKIEKQKQKLVDLEDELDLLECNHYYFHDTMLTAWSEVQRTCAVCGHDMGLI